MKISRSNVPRCVAHGRLAELWRICFATATKKLLPTLRCGMVRLSGSGKSLATVTYELLFPFLRKNSRSSWEDVRSAVVKFSGTRVERGRRSDGNVQRIEYGLYRGMLREMVNPLKVKTTFSLTEYPASHQLRAFAMIWPRLVNGSF